MTQRKLTMILVGLCLFMTMLYIASFVGGGRNAPETVTSALLNKKYAQSITKIVVSMEESSVTLESRGGFWLGFDDDIVFPASASKIQDLIDEMVSLRTMHVVSHGLEQVTEDGFGLDGSKVAEMQFFLGDGSLCSHLYFGGSNYSGKRIYVRGDGSHVYETDDDFFPWLTTVAKQWADMSLVPQSLIGSVSKEDVQRLLVVSDGQNRTMFPGSESFEEAVPVVLSLRGGALRASDAVGSADAILSVRLETGSGGIAEFSIYKEDCLLDDADQTQSYLVVPRVLPGVEMDGARIPADECRYALEISGWTYDRLVGVLVD